MGHPLVGRDQELALARALTGGRVLRCRQVGAEVAGDLLRLVPQTVVDNACNAIGHVLSQTPAAGTVVAPASAVDIRLGKRPSHPCP